MPVSASKLINKSLVVPKSWISTSLGRSRQIKPAVCHVVPAVKRAFSSKTARTPRRANWYSVLHPAEPPPGIKTNSVDTNSLKYYFHTYC
jgi:hypothetical protein